MLTLTSGNTIQGSAATASAVTYSIFGMEYFNAVENYKVLAQGQLGLTVVPLYTTAASTTAFVKTIMLANTTGSLVTNLKLLVNGTAVGNQIIPSLTIPANGMAILDDSGIKVYDSNGNLFTANTNGNIFDNTAVLPTTSAFGSAGSSVIAARRDHVHQAPGGLAVLNSNVTISNTQAQIVGVTLPADFMQVGTTFRLTATGKTVTTPIGGGDSVTFTVRIGPTTLTGTGLCNVPGFINDPAGSGFSIDALLTVALTGTSATVRLGIKLLGDSQGPTFTQPTVITNLETSGTFNTTVQNIIELTGVTSASTSSVSFGAALIEVVKL